MHAKTERRTKAGAAQRHGREETPPFSGPAGGNGSGPGQLPPDRPEVARDEDEDKALIAQALVGNPLAFRRLVEKHQDHVYDLCLRILGNTQDAEDVAQDTFVLFYRHLRDYREGHKVANWLYTIALNRCRRVLRKRRLIRFFSLDFFSSEPDPEAPIPEPAATEAAPDAALEKTEAEARTREILASLPDSLRAPFVLRHLKKMSYEDIARALKLSLPNVKVKLHRAKLYLWKKFGKKDPESV